jgi:hypothetical protein
MRMRWHAPNKWRALRDPRETFKRSGGVSTLLYSLSVKIEAEQTRVGRTPDMTV